MVQGRRSLFVGHFFSFFLFIFIYLFIHLFIYFLLLLFFFGGGVEGWGMDDRVGEGGETWVGVSFPLLQQNIFNLYL